MSSLIVPGQSGGWITLHYGNPSPAPHPADPAWSIAEALVNTLSDEASNRGARLPAWQEAPPGDQQFTATVVSRLLLAGVINVGPAVMR